MYSSFQGLQPASAKSDTGKSVSYITLMITSPLLAMLYFNPSYRTPQSTRIPSGLPSSKGRLLTVFFLR